MYDPYTVAFSTRLLTIWHKDPEKPGVDCRRGDDTCGWPWPNLNAQEIQYAEHLAGKDNDIDNLEWFFPSKSYEERLGHIKQIFRLHKGLNRRWWQHPRWHFWHWRLQIHHLQVLRRVVFERCSQCGGRFNFKESPVRDADGLRHMKCGDPAQLIANCRDDEWEVLVK